MGDYSKLIVACTVKAEVRKELEEKVVELGLDDSAYQSQEHVESILPNSWDSVTGENSLCVVLVGQTKWGDRQKEFCEWLKPHVVQGSGDNDVFAMSFSEYSDIPTIWKLREANK